MPGLPSLRRIAGAVRLLVVGGAGYIGSVTVEHLLAGGHDVTVLDNFSTGHPYAVPPGASTVYADLADTTRLGEVFREGRFEAVLHFAARSIVPESMTAPGSYFANNVATVVGLLNTMLARGVNKFVFSSSASVYGSPEVVPIPETAPLRPNNPYGASKAMVEQMLAWYSAGTALKYASLRYFNAAGASEQFGEDHRPETHLIPIAIEAAMGRRPEVEIYGTDYPTPDGTPVRDYIHVLDLAEAHARALEQLNGESIVCNLGTEAGYSVREVVETVGRVTGSAVPVRLGPRRPGDAPATVARVRRAREVLGWGATRGLAEMVESAWRWWLNHPRGYEGN